MLQSIRDFTKGKLGKVLLGILIIPFVLWGMGNVFSGGSQNTIATLNGKKISISDYINYFNSLNVNREFIINNPETKIFEEALSGFISSQVLIEEANEIGIVISEKGLAKIIQNDPKFIQNGKFSRTKYEKFLLENNVTAVQFEKKLKEETIKKLFFEFITGGLNSPKFLVEYAYNSENQERKVEFLNLDKTYQNNFSDEELKKFYLENQENFLQEFRQIKYAILSPNNLTNSHEFTQLFFDKVDEIDNLIANLNSIDQIAQQHNLKVETSKEININGIDLDGTKYTNLKDKILNEIFKTKDINEVQLINDDNQYLIYEVISTKNKLSSLKNKKVKENVTKVLTAKNIIKKNHDIQKNIFFKKDHYSRYQEMKKIAQNLGISINEGSINTLNDQKIFKQKEILKQIYDMNKNDIAVVSSKDYTKNYLVLIKDINNKKLNKDDEVYAKYLDISNVSLSNKILNSYDLYLNGKYRLDINYKTLDKVKNMYR